MSKYDMPLDLASCNGLSLIVDGLNRLENLKDGGTVLEMGSAEGRLTKYLHETLNLTVDIVEIDEQSGQNAAQFARSAYLGMQDGNLDGDSWFAVLKQNRYDVIIFADVLEHLRDPATVLNRCRTLLKKGGVVFASVPNIAHNSVILSLMCNRFPYTNLGLLDSTHIHFFTNVSFRDMAIRAGYSVLSEKTSRAAVGQNELPFDYGLVNRSVARNLKLRDNGEVYQYVFELAAKEDAAADKVEKVVGSHTQYYYCECFVKIDEAEEYSTQNRMLKYVAAKQNHTVKVRFSLADFPNAYALYFKPLNVECVLQPERFFFTDANGVEISAAFSCSGLSCGDTYIFPNDNPHFFINEMPSDAVSFTAVYKIIYFDDDFIRFYHEQISRLTNEFADTLADKLADEKRIADEKQKLSDENAELRRELSSGKVLLRRLLARIKQRLFD